MGWLDGGGCFTLAGQKIAVEMGNQYKRGAMNAWRATCYCTCTLFPQEVSFGFNLGEIECMFELLNAV